MTKKSVAILVASFILCFAAAGIGSLFTFEAIPTWYAALRKPFFNPPNYVFGPVWTLLYALMAISLSIVWSTKVTKKKLGTKNTALVFFGIQLFLNVLWSILFFGYHALLLAYVEIVLLWISIFLTIRSFNAFSRLSAQLLIPYILWVSFASILNFSVMWLNVIAIAP